MANASVSSCVVSIISSFTSGLDVFKRFRELRRSKKSRTKKQDKAGREDEVQLVSSLRRGPEDIGREYQRSISAVGEHFAHGDVVANTALAEVLLRLNTGLVTVINAFLARDKKETPLDYQSLTALSDASRVDTCRALRELYHRMMRSKSPRVPQQVSTADLRSPARRRSVSKRGRARGPVLARVVIADSSKPGQVAMVRSGERKKRKATKGGSTETSTATQSTANLAVASATRLPASGEPKHPPSPATNTRSQLSLHAPPAPRRKQSAPLLTSAPRSAEPTHRQLPWELSSTARPYPPRRANKPTPTFYSEASDATKLGEIPLHKWAQPVDFDEMSRLNKEAAKNGWPFNEIDSAPPKKKRGGFFGLFRRRTADV
ncbi:hypothetical protein CKM354_000203000 [Cercospora kikuchii]|uniref:Uncharacterized protein n=1 Tax=Cercospora kikuchii TaxID=84275 RepID=A0A9P3C977_9PEZI|nr:uncharacterized protein CKM354_000203000 [Cercospora kikuchii]GIZ38618.1 hypothetical protein CKM354_000203000 [Cercospora kikuchii]